MLCAHGFGHYKRFCAIFSSAYIIPIGKGS
nr:MAG TPA: hypothetical protein [Caudoviricetes sp.]